MDAVEMGVKCCQKMLRKSCQEQSLLRLYYLIKCLLGGSEFSILTIILTHAYICMATLPMQPKYVATTLSILFPGLLLGAYGLIFTESACRFLILSSTGLILYPLTLLSLSFAAPQQSKRTYKTENQNHDEELDRAGLAVSGSGITRVIGLLAGSVIFSLPFASTVDSAVGNCVLRVICFFYACKLLDLTVARAHSPPKLLRDGQVVEIDSRKKRLEYIWLLLMELRYRSFNIAVVEASRIQPAGKIWIYGPPTVAPILAYLFPTAETLFLLIFSTVYLSLEGIHKILHPRCPYPLFWQPFAATSITTFWGVNWHQGARPFLYSLGYTPVKRVFSKILGPKGGSAMGVLATFSLSGIWHGWAAAALVEEPWLMGASLWALFVGHGVACLAERLTMKDGRVSRLQGMITWVLAYFTASAWIKMALPRARI